MRRFEIETQLNEKVKTKSWIVRKLWPLVKDIIIDLIWEFLDKKRKENDNSNTTNTEQNKP